MLRRAWKPIVAGIAVGTPAIYYYTTYEKRETFQIPSTAKGADGRPEMVKKTFPLLPLNVVDSRIREHATLNTHARPGGTTWTYTTASLASNDPIEDANTQQVIQRDETDPSAPGDYLFFAVMDGHGGKETSQLLSRVLINAVVLEFSNLIKGSNSSTGFLFGIKSLLGYPLSQSAQTPPLHSDPKIVTHAIQNAFTKLDTELINAPIQVLVNNIDAEAKKNKVIPDLSKHPLALPTMIPAVSGSCALMAVFDTVHRDLYVACTGDSRAVAGIWEKTADGKGQWRVEALTEDQTGRNPNELKRLQSEHPRDEADHVVRGGRILGGLEPSRAFGDARYKWPRSIQETLNQAFLVGNGKPLRPPPEQFKTPPYVTALPVVTHRKLDFSNDSDISSSEEKSLRFVVLATDGLWDQLSSEEVVGLVAGHLTGLRGTISKSKLSTMVPTSVGTPGVDGKEKKKNMDKGSWAFTDENVSTHLIRNAFGGGDHEFLRKLISIPAPYSRRYRDDVTVTVVWWEDGKEDAAQLGTVKAKL